MCVICCTGSRSGQCSNQESSVKFGRRQFFVHAQYYAGQSLSRDFPSHFVNLTHPDDYKQLNSPLPVDFINHRSGFHDRITLRISWRSKDVYISMSFIVDTRCCYGFELPPRPWTFWKRTDSENGAKFVYVHLEILSAHPTLAIVSEPGLFRRG